MTDRPPRPGRFATPLTMQSLGDMSYADIGRQLGAGRRLLTTTRAVLIGGSCTWALR